MKKMAGLALLILGVCVAGAFGSRNGTTHTSYRAEQWAVATNGVEATVALPGPQQRLSEWFAAGGVGWLGGVVLILGGAVLARQAVAEENAGGGSTSAGRVDFQQAVGETRTRIESLKAQIAELSMDDDAPAAREALDRIAAELLEPLVDGRGQLIAKHGIGGFAEYFGPFSSGERLLNRTWSALTDGHAVVAREALDKADEAFGLALKTYEQVDTRA